MCVALCAAWIFWQKKLSILSIVLTEKILSNFFSSLFCSTLVHFPWDPWTSLPDLTWSENNCRRWRYVQIYLKKLKYKVLLNWKNSKIANWDTSGSAGPRHSKNISRNVILVFETLGAKFFELKKTTLYYDVITYFWNIYT